MSQRGVKIIDVKCLMFSLWSTRKLWWFKESENIYTCFTDSFYQDSFAIKFAWSVFSFLVRVWKTSIKKMASFLCLHKFLICSRLCLLFYGIPQMASDAKNFLDYQLSVQEFIYILISGLYLLIVKTNTDYSWWVGREITTAQLCRKRKVMKLK